MRKLPIRLRKLSFCLFRPRTWRFLIKGVTPTIDHAIPLSALPITKILDVGANRGQFALFARGLWPSADIICFEPLPGPCRLLNQLFASPSIRIMQIALSDVAGRSPMYVTKSDDSSSLMPIGENQKKLSNTVVKHVEEFVTVDTLDNVLADEPLPLGTLLKIDVQGFEEKVLHGAVETLRRLSWVYAECSFQELYVGQSLASSIVAFMDQQNFELTGVFNQVFDPVVGAVQADFLFARRKARLPRD